MRQFLLVALAAVTVPLLAACKPASGSSAAFDDQDMALIGDKKTKSGVAPAQEDVLMLSYGDDPDTINVVTGNDTVSDAFQRLVYEYFADRDMANPDKWENLLAESWTFDEKSLEYTLRLRKGVMWHPMALPDGTLLPTTEFSAQDVKFTFDCILNPHVSAGHIRSYYEDPEAKEESDKIKITVSVVDPHTVKIKWKKPYFLSDDYTLRIQPIPKHVFSVDAKGEPISLDLSSKEFAEGFNNHWANSMMCGTGPLRFAEWKKNERLVLRRNNRYWGTPFYFSQIIYRCIPNNNTTLQMALQNELDTAGIPDKDMYLQTKKHASVTGGKVTLFEYTPPSYRYLGFNLERELFKDRRVRWAISHAIPIDQIIEKVLYGLAVRCSGPFLQGSSANDPSVKPVPFDLVKAKALLDEAGWKDTDGSGFRDKTINDVKVEARFDLMIFSDSPTFKTIAEIIQENLRQVGVDVQLSPTKWALMLQKLKKKEFDATILGWIMDWKQDPFQIWHSSQADIPDSSNSISYRNAEVDRRIEALRVTMDPAKQTKLYNEIHRLIFDDQPYTFLFNEKATGARHARIQNVTYYPVRPNVNSREWRSSSPRIMGQ